MVQTLAAADELQRELTYDGLRAAVAKNSKGGRRQPLEGAPGWVFAEGHADAMMFARQLLADPSTPTRSATAGRTTSPGATAASCAGAD